MHNGGIKMEDKLFGYLLEVKNEDDNYSVIERINRLIFFLSEAKNVLKEEVTGIDAFIKLHEKDLDTMIYDIETIKDIVAEYKKRSKS